MTLLERVATSPLNYRATFVVDPLAALAFGYYGAIAHHGPRTAAIAYVATGILLWGFLEYLLHRFVLHGALDAPRREHAKHHVESKAEISTPLLVIPIGALLIDLFLSLFLRESAAALLTCGIYAGYNYFAIVHHLLHHHADALSRVPWFGAQVRFHVAHHRHPGHHYGISSALWDRLFGTFLQDDQVVVKQPR
jgi:sterol desaturase/sphingolipid hydroxylase (fatty acid hydroxylase superfamily)